MSEKNNGTLRRKDRGTMKYLWWWAKYWNPQTRIMELGLLNCFWATGEIDISSEDYRHFAWDRHDWDCFLEQIWAVHEGLA